MYYVIMGSNDTLEFEMPVKRADGGLPRKSEQSLFFMIGFFTINLL